MPIVDEPRELLAIVRQLRADVTATGAAIFEDWRPWIRRRAFLPAAVNLSHYLALRRHRLTELQDSLARLGLSSLGRGEAPVLPNIDSVAASLAAICHEERSTIPRHPSRRAFYRGQRLLERQIEAIWGPLVRARQTRIMATLPTEAASDPELLRDLVRSGIDCVRINCAHDSPEAWEAMIGQLRRAEQDLDVAYRVRVLMDLGGPKVRTSRPSDATDHEQLLPGGMLLLARDPTPHAVDGLPVVGCTLPGIVEQLHLGARVLIDDGKIATSVVGLREDGALLQVTRVGKNGKVIRSEKGLNFPDTDLEVSPLTDVAQAARAECVMLNKGPYVTEATALLDEVLPRMQRRQRKNAPLLPVLPSWQDVLSFDADDRAASLAGALPG